MGAAGCVPVPANVHPECYVYAWNRSQAKEALADVQRQCDTTWNDLIDGTDFFSRSMKRLGELDIGTRTLPEPFCAR